MTFHDRETPCLRKIQTAVNCSGFTTHENAPVAGVGSMLNSATVMPRDATSGANIAAGLTTDDVPT